MSDSTRRPPHEKWAIVDDPSNIAKFLAQVPRSTATRYPAPPNTTTSLNEGTDNGGNLAASSMTSLNESRHADTSEGANTSQPSVGIPARTSSARPMSIVSTGSVTEGLAHDFAQMSLDASVVRKEPSDVSMQSGSRRISLPRIDFRPLFSDSMSGVQLAGDGSEMSGIQISGDRSTTPMSGIESAGDAGDYQSPVQQSIVSAIRMTLDAMDSGAGAQQGTLSTNTRTDSDNNHHLPMSALSQSMWASTHAFEPQEPPKITFQAPRGQGIESSDHAPWNASRLRQARQAFGQSALDMKIKVNVAARKAGDMSMPDRLLRQPTASPENKSISTNAIFPTRREGIAPYSEAPPSPPSQYAPKIDEPVYPLPATILPSNAPQLEPVPTPAKTASEKQEIRLAKFKQSLEAQQSWSQAFLSAPRGRENRAPRSSRAGIFTATPESIEAAKKSVHRSDPVSEKTVTFKAWPLQGERDAPAAGIRRVKLSNLPRTATPALILRIVWGGKIDAIYYTRGSTWADVLFVKPEDCKKYADATANGVTWPGDGRTIWVEPSTNVEPVSSLLRDRLDKAGATRCIRVIGADSKWSAAECEKLAASGNRKVEKVIVSMTPAGHRVVDFHFCNIEDAFIFKAKLAKDEDFDPCNVTFAVDPCEVARGVHLH